MARKTNLARGISSTRVTVTLTLYHAALLNYTARSTGQTLGGVVSRIVADHFDGANMHNLPEEVNAGLLRVLDVQISFEDLPEFAPDVADVAEATPCL